MRFNHLEIPSQWQHYWTKYPEGYTILEALLNWVKQVNSMTDNINDWNDRLDEFIAQFDSELQDTVKLILSEWKESGILEYLIQESLYSLHEMMINVKDYGAKGDGVTDDTDAIRAAMLAVPRGGKLIFPPAEGYLCKPKTEPYLFLWDKPFIIEGYGRDSKIIVSDEVNTTTDIFLITPSNTDSDDGYRGYNMKGLTVTTENGEKVGRHILHFDLTVTGKKIANSVFEKNFFHTTGGVSIKLTNPTNTDGFFTNVFSENLIFGGIELERCGDSVAFNSNVIAGTNKVDVSMVYGSNTFILFENNITCRGGVILRSGHNMKVLNNNLEVGYEDSAYENNALLDIDGSGVDYAWGIMGAEIRGNNFTYRSTAPYGIDAIRINKARGAIIEGNYIALKESNHINVTDLATETTINYNAFSGVDPAGTILDSGRNTQRNNVHVTNALGTREVYQHIVTNLRNQCSIYHLYSDELRLLNKTAGSPAYLNFTWDETITTKTKAAVSTQEISSLGTPQTRKQVFYFGDGKVHFPADNICLQDGSGKWWTVRLNGTDGSLVTTKME